MIPKRVASAAPASIPDADGRSPSAIARYGGDGARGSKHRAFTVLVFAPDADGRSSLGTACGGGRDREGERGRGN